MKVLNIKSSDLQQFKLVTNGAESKIYLYQDKIIKIYENPEDYNIKKIKYLSLVQQYIENTILPYGIVNIDETFSGCLQYYFKNYSEFDVLNKNIPFEQVMNYFKMFLKSLNELVENKIYPVDLFYGNVLVSLIQKDVQIIDLDGNGSIIQKSENKKLLQESLELYISTILECLYYKDIDKEWFINYKSLLERYPFKKEYIDIIINKKITFEFLNEFLNYIKKDKNKILKLKH